MLNLIWEQCCHACFEEDEIAIEFREDSGIQALDENRATILTPRNRSILNDITLPRMNVYPVLPAVPGTAAAAASTTTTTQQQIGGEEEFSEAAEKRDQQQIGGEEEFSEAEKRDKLLPVFRGFVIELVRGMLLLRHIDEEKTGTFQFQISEDLLFFLMDANDGKIVQFPVNSVTTLTCTPTEKGQEHKVTLFFGKKRRLPFLFETLNSATRFMILFDLLVQLVQERERLRVQVKHIQTGCGIINTLQ